MENLDHVLTTEYQRETIERELNNFGKDGIYYGRPEMKMDNTNFILRNWKKRKDYTCRVAIKASIIRLRILKEKNRGQN